MLTFKLNLLTLTRRATLAAAVSITALGCSPTENPTPNKTTSSVASNKQEATLTGNVVYRQRIALPPKSTITVQLQDVSLADAPAKVLAKQVIVTERQQVPIPFQLKYQSDELDARHRYVVRADIRDPNGTLIWVTDTSHPVLTREAPTDSIDIRVVQATRSNGAEAAPNNNASGNNAAIALSAWNLESITTPDGGIQRPKDGQPFTLQFLEDNRFAGQAFCNRFAGSYTLKEGNNIEFGQVAATLAACRPSSLGGRFLPLLHEVDQLKTSGNKLVLTTTNSQQLIFVKSEEPQTSSTPDQRAPMIPQQTVKNYVFSCSPTDSESFTFKTRTGPGELALWLPERFDNRYLVLGQVRAASGARYEGDGVTVWNKGSNALLIVNDEMFMDCELQV